MVPLTGLTVLNYFNIIKISSLEKEAVKKDEMVSDVMVQMVIENYDINDCPFPMGFKIYDRETKEIQGAVVNNAYQLRHGFGTSTYFGQNDMDMSSNYGKQWYQNDLKVLEGPEMKRYVFDEDSDAGPGKWHKWWRNKNASPDVRYVRLYFLEI